MQFISLALLVLAAGASGADRAAGEAVDLSGLLQPIIARHHIPGMVALTIRGQEVIASGAAGLRKTGSTRKITLEDQFHIGSCTKAMTATLCAMLVEEGKLKWDTTVGEAFPELHNQIDGAWQGVTLRLLLQHRAGAPPDLDANGLWSRLSAFHGAPEQARQLLTEGVVTHPPYAKPGMKFIYSNAGFAIAGHMAERVMH
jgi:CubicO group peptidase (beta-lactamase class C family)